MGMFDTIHCEYPLPDPRHQELEYQTKHLECLLDEYTITYDGRLIRHARRGGLWAGPDRDVEWPLHGDISIYTSDSEKNWVEYTVRFTHGRVEWIRPRAEAPPSSERSEEPEEPPPSVPGAGEPAPPAAAGERAAPSAEEALLQNLRRDRAELERLLAATSDHWGYEDPVYRFYHQSFKVYGLQRQTLSIVERLQALAPDRPLNRWFADIVAAGTGKRFTLEDNARWTEVTRPILEAFFHARFFLEMAVHYSDLEAPPHPLPSGYAALLYLFGLR